MTNIVSGTEYFLLNFSKDQRGTRYRRRVIFRRIVNYRKSRSFIARFLPPSHPFVRSLLLLPRTWHTSHPLNRRLGPRLKSFFISRVLFWLVTLQKWGMSSRGRQAGTHREGEKKKKNSMGNDFPITSYNYGIATRLITINRCLKRGGGGVRFFQFANLCTRNSIKLLLEFFILTCCLIEINIRASLITLFNDQLDTVRTIFLKAWSSTENFATYSNYY